MRVPIVCLDERLRQFVATFSSCFSKPQRKYFVIVLLGLMLCWEPRTLSGLLRQVSAEVSLSGASRFLAEAPWSAETLAATWQSQYVAEMSALVAAEHQRQRRLRPKRRGRPPGTLVTGYLIGDDSTLSKRRGKKMGGLGVHHSTTEGKRIVGHSLVLGLYVLLGRRCPLTPQMYRQKAVCEREGVPFQSKIDLMEAQIRNFEPVPDTVTHVLLDTWYTAKRIWQAARERGFLITSGLKNNRWLRIEDPEAPGGWRWQKLADYSANLTAADYVLLPWPRQEEDQPRQVYVHVISTRVRKLYRCQVIIVRTSLDAPHSQTRYWASSDLTADAATLLTHIATRWDIEVLFADSKELLGLDHYQVMTATSIQRFWTLVMAAYAFLEQERFRLSQDRQEHVTIGQTRRHVQLVHHYHMLHWLHQQFQADATPDQLAHLLLI